MDWIDRSQTSALAELSMIGMNSRNSRNEQLVVPGVDVQ